ncbi:MAG: hypothetical protein NDI69_06655 [Bacteriovoracaceae bacterium]|nr:hypothetical protein [Bacteriovoracaceae bacterium]
MNMDDEDKILKLMQLEKKVLAKTLITLSGKHSDVASAIDRMISDKTANVRRFISGLSAYKSDSNFRGWSEASEFAEELEELLSDLEEGASCPREAIKLLKSFFESDHEIVHRCDDSSGFISNVFRYRATELFVKSATECDDKDWLANILWDLITHNDYGLRDELIDKIGQLLPERNMREIVERLWALHQENKDGERIVSRELILLEAMAKGLKDPLLLEKVIREEGENNPNYNNGCLGEMYFLCGDFKKAIHFLEKVEKSSSHYWKVDDLLLKAYAEVGDVVKQKKMAWDIFRSHRTKEYFEAVLEIEGHSKYQELLKHEIDIIFQDKELKNQNVDFLFEMELFDEAEAYIISRRKNLNGNHYEILADWAELFDLKKKVLVSTFTYRALLDSILERAYSKAYHHGVDYLVKLNEQADLIQDWKGGPTHNCYFENLKNDHKRKHGFWSQYKSRY